MITKTLITSGDNKHAPSVGNYPTSTDEDVDKVITHAELLSNSTDQDGDTLIVIGVSSPVNGTVVDNGDNTVTFSPDANYNGNASFTFEVDDQDGSTATGQCLITINPINDPLVSSNFTLGTIIKNFSIEFSDSDILANVSDIDSTPTVSSVYSNSNGTLTDNGDGTYLFESEPDYIGDATIQYTATDGEHSSGASITVTTRNKIYIGSPVQAPTTKSCADDANGNSTFVPNATEGGTLTLNIVANQTYDQTEACARFLGNGIPSDVRRYIEFDFSATANGTTVNPTASVHLYYYDSPINGEVFFDGVYQTSCNNIAQLDMNAVGKYTIGYDGTDDIVYFGIFLEADTVDGSTLSCTVANVLAYY